MTILVTGCHDCKMCDKDDKWCMILETHVHRFYNEKTIHSLCKLQTESITIKKKDNEKNYN